MANTLRFKRGLVSGIPTAALGEPLFTTDTFDLYIGNGTGNTRFQKYIASGTTSQLLRGDGSLYTFPLNISSPTNGQVLKYNGTSWVNDSDAGITGSGTTNYLPKFTGASTLGNSLVFDNGTNVLINTTTALWTAGGRQTFEINGGSQSLLALNVSNTSAGYLWHSGTYLSLANTRNSYISFVTNSAEYMRLHATGNLHLGGTSDNGLRLQVTGDGYFSGSVGIGTTALTDQSLLISKNISGSTIPNVVHANGVIQSSVTNATNYFITGASTVAASFTLPVLRHYIAVQGTFGAGSAVTNQFGFQAHSSLIGATNNYGFYGDIASGTGRWNLYMNGTASNYMAGSLGIGTTGLSNTNLSVNKNLTGLANVYGIFNSGSIRSDVTTGAQMFTSAPSIQNAVFTLAGLKHFEAVGISSVGSATITTQFGFYVESTLTGATTNYGFYSVIAAATGRWNLFMDGTANNFMRGSLLIGSSTTSTGEALQVNGTMRVSGASTFNSTATIGAGTYKLLSFDDASGAGWRTTGGASIAPYMYLYLSGTSGQIGFYINNNPKFAITNSGIDVTGAATFSSSVTAGGNITSSDGTSSTIVQTATNAPRIVLIDGRVGGRRFDLGSLQSGAGTFSITDNTAGLARFTILSDGSATFSSNVNSGGNLLLTNGNAGTIGAINLVRTGTSPVASRLTFGTDGTGYSFAIGKNQGGTVTDLLTILDSGAATFSSSIQASTAIAIGTTPDTNKPFKILKNINGTVGINFENTSTGSSAFSAIQMGTDVSGGTAFANLVYSSSGVTATGVYQPSGTSLINTGSGGLNFLSVSQPIRFFTSTGNGTERLRITNDGDITHYNGTSPSASTTDAYRMYSADVVAGNAAPHFRTENGAVIKLYQETTAVGNSTISVGGGNAVLDDTEFDGYTLRQIVRALRNQGILQ